jgi:gamma-glutamylaminecyclotransferase
MHLLFVYGSLKSGLSNHRRLAGAACLDGRASAEGYGLVRYVAGYPALVEAPGRTAQGEVYVVQTDVLEELDEFEECPSVYTRKAISVKLSDGSTREVFAYLAAQPEEAEPHSGDTWHPPADLIPFENR